MALVKCCECGNSVSTRANACPRCGAPIASDVVARAKNVGKDWEPCPRCGSNKVESKGACVYFFVGFVLIVVGFLLLGCLPPAGMIGILAGVLGMLISPFFYRQLACQDCKHAWRYPSRKTMVERSTVAKPAIKSAGVSGSTARGCGYFLALLFGVVCIGIVLVICIGFFPNLPRPNGVPEPAGIHYEVLHKSADGSNRFYMQVLVDEAASEAEVMDLAKTLSREFAGQYASIDIFDSREAWSSRADEKYPKQKYWQHYLVQIGSEAGAWTDGQEVHWVAKGRTDAPRAGGAPQPAVPEAKSTRPEAKKVIDVKVYGAATPRSDVDDNAQKLPPPPHMSPLQQAEEAARRRRANANRWLPQR